MRFLMMRFASLTVAFLRAVSYGNTVHAEPLPASTASDFDTPLLARAEVAPRVTATAKAKKVFAHYMLGTVTSDHAHKDIDDAIAMGVSSDYLLITLWIDGFALNIGDPTQPFIGASLGYLFGYAAFRGFQLYFSLDVYASGNACYQGSTGSCNGPYDYHTLLADNLGQTAYFLGPNGKPLISTFSSGGLHNDAWASWKETFANQMYFIPDFDETLGYYSAAAGWWEYWGDVVDGIFSWEAAWPLRSGFGGNYPGDISPDLPVLEGATAHGKGYMMALSALQYKNSYGANVYRAGDLNLPTRMENILAMSESPDYIQVITWNDGPEGHYIGNLWIEQNNDSAPYKYANEVQWPHSGWQSLIASFIAAWKADATASEMAPPSGQPAIGAMWYKTILQSSTCPVGPNAATRNLTDKPDGFDTGTDQLNYAVVVEPGATYTLQAFSNGVALAPVTLHPGLNYGAFTGVQAGHQRMELHSGGTIVLAASGGRCISAGCPDCIYNMNSQVVPLGPDTGAVGTCPYAVCQKSVFAHYMVGNVNEDHAHQDIDDAVAMGLDGFALNVGDPTQPFVRQTFNYIFDYTRDNYPNFKLFISMDLWAEGNAFNGVEIEQYHDIVGDFKGHGAYLQGPDGNSFISTFSSGGLQQSNWTAWRAEWNDEVYFVPDFDDTAGYNTSDPGWWAYWGDVVQGTFSWETAWPKVGVPAVYPGDAVDQVVVDGTFDHVKAYMMPLSTLQYKNSYDTNYYREGSLNLPQRIQAILSLKPSPDFVEYITWNDGPESHYIGNLWLEQNNDTQPLKYANSDASHKGWQPLITSFIAAFKAGLSGYDMAPPSGQVAVGAIWYNPILTSSTCPGDGNGQYSNKPDGFETAKDQLNWAVVVEPGTQGLTVHAFSGGNGLQTIYEVNPSGLTYGYWTGISAGLQRMELRDSNNNILLAADGGRCISSECPDCIYNLNPVVVPLVASTSAAGTCQAEENCQDGGAEVYVDPSVWTGSNPVMGCNPPCTILLPPYQLGTTTTVSWPVLTTTLWSSSADGYFYTITTTISIPAITTTEISFFPISVGATETTQVTVSAVQSVAPPYYILSLPSNEGTFEPSPTYSRYTYSYNPTAVSSSTTGAVIIGGRLTSTPTASSTSYAVTIRPQPTKSIPITSIPTPTFTSGAPKTTCSTGCAKPPDCTDFGCPPTSTRSNSPPPSSSSSNHDCGLFSCWGGCGFWGCSTSDGGGCGIGGCGGGCPICGICVIPPCSGPCPLGQCGGGNCEGTANCDGPGGDDGDGDNGCEEPQTITNYWVSCSTINPTSTSCTTTESLALTGCDLNPTTVTTTEAACSATIVVSSDDDQGEDGPNPGPLTATSAPTTTTDSGPNPTSVGGLSCSLAASGSWITPSQASSVAAEFCNSVAGQTVHTDVQNEYKEGTVSVNFLITSQDPTCPAITVDLNVCNAAYAAVISGCTTPGGQNHGGQVGVGNECYLYGYSILPF